MSQARADDRRIVLAVSDRLDVVVGGELGRLAPATCCDALNPLGHLAVQVAALGSRERAIGDIAGERVLEGELPQAGHRRLRLT